jgi:hypothetical protein
MLWRGKSYQELRELVEELESKLSTSIKESRDAMRMQAEVQTQFEALEKEFNLMPRLFSEVLCEAGKFEKNALDDLNNLDCVLETCKVQHVRLLTHKVANTPRAGDSLNLDPEEELKGLLGVDFKSLERLRQQVKGFRNKLVEILNGMDFFSGTRKKLLHQAAQCLKREEKHNEAQNRLKERIFALEECMEGLMKASESADHKELSRLNMRLIGYLQTSKEETAVTVGRNQSLELEIQRLKETDALQKRQLIEWMRSTKSWTSTASEENIIDQLEFEITELKIKQTRLREEYRRAIERLGVLTASNAEYGTRLSELLAINGEVSRQLNAETLAAQELKSTLILERNVHQEELRRSIQEREQGAESIIKALKADLEDANATIESLEAQALHQNKTGTSPPATMPRHYIHLVETLLKTLCHDRSELCIEMKEQVQALETATRSLIEQSQNYMHKTRLIQEKGDSSMQMWSHGMTPRTDHRDSSFNVLTTPTLPLAGQHIIDALTIIP